MQRNRRALKAKGAKEIQNNGTRGEIWKRKTKNCTQHGSETRDVRVRKRALATKKKKEVRNLGNGRAGDRMAMRVTPGTIDGPFRLVVQPSGVSATEGKLSSHCRREALVARCSLDSRHAAS